MARMTRHLWFLSFLGLIALATVSPGQAAVGLTTPTQLVVGVPTSIEVTGLTDTNYYIITYSFSSLANLTFQASGYKYSYLLLAEELDADTLTLTVYDYSTSTGQNSSVAHTSRTINVVTTEYYDQRDTIFELFLWLAPMGIIAFFVVAFVRSITK